MMSTWQDFLHTQRLAQTQANAFCSTSAQAKALIALDHLGVLSLTGSDATQFLQGQMTCDIKEVSDTQSRFGAFCDVKGKVLTTFIISKIGDEYRLILPKVLIALIKTRLQRYVLRAKVIITDKSEQLCLIGTIASNIELVFSTTTDNNHQIIHLHNRQLIITSIDNAIGLWQEKLAQGFQVQAITHWHCADIIAGIAWLDLNSSEQFIPQMLGVDKLGGISFTKGCYTGQEIVARTHYLGKVNRSLLTAEVISTTVIESNSIIMDDNGQTIGRVLTAQLLEANRWLVLLVLSNSETERHLYLSDKSELRLLESSFT